MDFMNSQHLTYQDGYLHVFRQAGTYTYQVLVASQAQSDTSYTIEVAAEGRAEGNGDQQDVVLRWDAVARTYYPEPARLSIGVNDFVLWRVETQEAGTPPFSIVGESKEKPAFDSRTLGQYDVFTHLFMAPGRYVVNINQKAVGRIAVRDHREMAVEAYDKELQNALVMRVAGGRTEPASGNITAGQTVLWYVEKGERITISAEAESPGPDMPKGDTPKGQTTKRAPARKK
jgi:plastocyanin